MELTISIPTYNRAAKLDICLARIAAQIKSASMPVRVSVFDNCSTDSTGAVLGRWRAQGLPLEVSRNDRNLGFSRNYALCVTRCNTEFLWIVGDDDLLQPQALLSVTAELQALPYYGFRLLNHLKVVDGDFGPPVFPAVADDSEFHPIELFERCMAHEYGSPMFISAGIFRAAAARKALESWPDVRNNVAVPLFIAGAVTSQQGMRLVRDVCLAGNYSGSFWQSRSFELHMIDMPLVMHVLMKEHRFSTALCQRYLADSSAYFARPRARMLTSFAAWWRAYRTYATMQKIAMHA